MPAATANDTARGAAKAAPGRRAANSGRPTKGLEGALDELFYRNAPRLPRLARKALAAWTPLFSLLAAVAALRAAWGAWHWSQTTGRYIGVCNAYSVSGCGNLTFSHSSGWLWTALGLAAASGLLFLLAVPGLRARRRGGWRCAEAALLLIIPFAIVSLFTSYDKISHCLGGLAGAGAGLYILYQIHGRYSPRRRPGRQPVPVAVPVPVVPPGSTPELPAGRHSTGSGRA